MDIAASDRGAITAAAGTLATVLYYGLVRALETRWPIVGVFLGTTKTPTYARSTDTTADPYP